MKVLILSCDTGEGHNSAGRAVKEFVEKQLRFGLHLSPLMKIIIGVRILLNFDINLMIREQNT